MNDWEAMKCVRSGNPVLHTIPSHMIYFFCCIVSVLCSFPFITLFVMVRNEENSPQGYT